MHSCRREIDELTTSLQARKVQKLFKPIQVAIEKPPEPEPVEQVRPRRLRCQRREFEFSMDSMWLDEMYDSQETIMPSDNGDDEVILPTWQ